MVGPSLAVHKINSNTTVKPPCAATIGRTGFAVSSLDAPGKPNRCCTSYHSIHSAGAMLEVVPRGTSFSAPTHEYHPATTREVHISGINNSTCV